MGEGEEEDGIEEEVGEDVWEKGWGIKEIKGFGGEEEGQGRGGRERRGVEGEKGTNYSTTVKMLAVMLQKGLVKRDENARPFVYRAALTRKKAGKGMLHDLIDKVYEGSALSLVLQALSTGKATKAELSEVRRLLDRMEEE